MDYRDDRNSMGSGLVHLAVGVVIGLAASVLLDNKRRDQLVSRARNFRDDAMDKFQDAADEWGDKAREVVDSVGESVDNLSSDRRDTRGRRRNGSRNA